MNQYFVTYCHDNPLLGSWHQMGSEGSNPLGQLLSWSWAAQLGVLMVREQVRIPPLPLHILPWGQAFCQHEVSGDLMHLQHSGRHLACFKGQAFPFIF